MSRTPGTDKAMESDRRFFERWPERTCRIRRAYPGEIEELHRPAGYEFVRLPKGWVYVVAVRNIAPGARIRMPMLAPRTNSLDVSEAEADAVIKAMMAGFGATANPAALYEKLRNRSAR